MTCVVKWLDQSQYNRRAPSRRYLLNALRKDWAAQLGVPFEQHFLLDTTPVIAVGYRRDKRHSALRGSADYGYKLVMLTTRENQQAQNSPEFDCLLNNVRARSEGACELLKEGGRSVEHSLAYTVGGLCARIIAKIASVTLRLLRRFCGIDVVTYTVSA